MNPVMRSTVIVALRRWGVWFLFLLYAGLSFSVIAAPRSTVAATTVPEIRIGVLALRGPQQAEASWSATATYLNEKIPGYHFRIVPLTFDTIEPKVAHHAVDFVIVNPVLHVILAERYGASPMATMINRLDQYDASLYGGVIFRPAGIGEAPDLNWLVDKRFLAVDPLSLGGYLAAALELHKRGIDPLRDFASLKFAGTHDAVVEGVLAGRADAGTVRTDVLERMAAEGKIDLTQIQVIAPYRNGGSSVYGYFPYVRSTRLYPEWSFSKIVGVPDLLARKISMALLAMPADSAAARHAGIVGWNVPMTYVPVVDLLRELALPPFEPEPISVLQVLDKHPLVSLLTVLGFLLVGVLVVNLVGLNNRLRLAQKSLQITNLELESRVKQRTEALEASEKELEKLAAHDPLTGLLNRRSLEVQILNEVNRVNRYGYPLSAFMLDIDFFKKVNDGFGHAAGDSVLKELALLLQQVLRNTDIIARYGGEEFVVVLPMTTGSDAEKLAHRLCEAVAAHDMVLPDGQLIRVTISIGVASVQQTGKAHWEDLIDTADQAMYAAKQSGRNRVCTCSGQSSPSPVIS